MHWGLERVGALLAELGWPDRSFQILHIAGTNGKGSTAGFAASVLREGGYRTGLFTSPHLTDIRERFLVDGRWIDEALIQRVASRVLACRATAACTYFEATTALALACFAECLVDVAVLEAGLGGRLDATTAVQPVGTAITTVGLDHTAVLGASLSAIAAEKAGILKRDVPVAVGRMDSEALQVIAAGARKAGAPMALLGRDAEIAGIRVGGEGTAFSYASPFRPGVVDLATKLPGAHQADNAALALMMLDLAGYELDEAVVRRGVSGTRVPGRFEMWHGERARGSNSGSGDGIGRGGWIFDIAHNVSAIEALCETLAQVGLVRPLVTVAGVLEDKEWKPMLASLARASDALVLTVPSSAGRERRWNPKEAGRWISLMQGSDVKVSPNVGDAVALGREIAGESGTVLVTGSAYTVGEARAALGVGAANHFHQSDENSPIE